MPPIIANKPPIREQNYSVKTKRTRSQNTNIPDTLPQLYRSRLSAPSCIFRNNQYRHTLSAVIYSRSLPFIVRTPLLINPVLDRLWAEVFHVSASGAGTVKWQQVSEDLVPVNITCIQDSPECVFHITAYNSQVDKILDVRLVQPGRDHQCKPVAPDPSKTQTKGP